MEQRKKARPTEHRAGFDPYLAWLGVQEIRRPLNPYELLGLESLEDDLEVIRSAAELKRAAMESHRVEAPPAVWEQVSNELEEAIGILSNPHRKLAHDIHLELRDKAPPSPQGSRSGKVEYDHQGQLRCPQCGTRSPATRRFCTHCGGRLWEPCLQCGTLCSAGEEYCSSCGSNVAANIARQIDQYDMDLLSVARLQLEGRYDEAFALLTPMSTVEHPRLTSYATRAAQLLQQLGTHKQRRLAEADAALKRAEEHFSRRDYAGALRCLEEVPVRLLSEPMQRLMADARMRQLEVATLSKELQQAIRAQQAAGVMPKIERLLELKPDLIKVRQIAAQLEQRYCQSAEKKLAKFDYEGADTLLEAVPQSVRSTDFAPLYKRAADLACLFRDLRTAPVADKMLLAAAERLQSLSPTDPQIPAFLEKLRQRCKAASQQFRITPLSWTAMPEPTSLGFPVDWMTGFRRIACAPSLDGSALVEHPGCFAVACGLGLQALGQVSLDLNLAPAQRGSVLDRIASLVRRPPTAVWGLDLGASSLKAVKLTWDENEKRAVLQQVVWNEHRKLLTHAVREGEEDNLIEEGVQALLSECKGEPICLGLPSRMILTRQFRTPPVISDKLDKMIDYEARRQFPMSLGELAWDYRILGEPNGVKPTKRQQQTRQEYEVLLIAVKKTQMQRRLDLLQRLGLRADWVQSDCVALHNFMLHEHAAKTASDDRKNPASPAAPADPAEESLWPIATLDLGADSSDLVISSPQGFWSRNLGFGGQHVVRAFAKEFNLGGPQAEQLLRDLPAAPDFAKLYQILDGVFETLANDLHTSLAAWARVEGYAPIRRMFGVGGLFQLHGLLRHLSRDA